MNKTISIFVFSFFFLCNCVKAQTISNFARGYKVGFREGYCYGIQGTSCLSPIAPLAPRPGLYESVTSYQDGFNKGFQEGLDLQRAQSQDTRNPYNPPVPKFNPYISQIPSGMTAQQYAEARAASIAQKNNSNRELVVALANVLEMLFSKKDKTNDKAEQIKGFSKIIKKTNQETEKIEKQNKKLQNNNSNNNSSKESYFDGKYKFQTTSDNNNNSNNNSLKNSDYDGKYKFQTTFDNPVMEVPLREQPDASSREVYKCPKNAIVYVIDNSGTTFIKVNVNGYTGYISKGWLIRQE